METRATTKELLSRMDAGWKTLQEYIGSLNDEQLSTPKDAGGWTVKDHLMHLAVWQDGIQALLRKESRHRAMGLTDALWENGEVDEINGYLQELHVNKPVAEIRRLVDESYKRLTATIGSLSDDELNMPYSHYDSSTDRENPVFGWIVGNTFEHYAEHLPWMQAIVAQK